MKILMIEDEKRLAGAVAQILKKNNYSVDLAFDGEDGLDYALSGLYDTIVLDIMLPKRDGLSVLKSLRQNGIRTPVILLTAKGETEDKVKGLDSGADDYLAKPFQTDELLARLRALGRRKGEIMQDSLLRFGDIEYNPHTLDMYCRDKSFHLTLKEGQLLELLLQGRGITLSIGITIEKLWGYDTETEDSHVQVYISFLRKKLAQLDSEVKIQTIRGAGYVLSTAKGG